MLDRQATLCLLGYATDVVKCNAAVSAKTMADDVELVAIRLKGLFESFTTAPAIPEQPPLPTECLAPTDASTATDTAA